MIKINDILYKYIFQKHVNYFIVRIYKQLNFKMQLNISVKPDVFTSNVIYHIRYITKRAINIYCHFSTIYLSNKINFYIKIKFAIVFITNTN